MTEPSKPRPKPKRLPEKIKLKSKPVLKLRTRPNGRDTK